MTIAFLNEAHANGINGPTINQPDDGLGNALLPTDVMVCSIVIYDDATVFVSSVPAGWTIRRTDPFTDGVTGHQMVQVTITAIVGAGAASYTFGTSGAFNFTEGAITAWRGVDNTTPYASGAAESSFLGGNGPNANSPGITPAQAGVALFFAVGYNAGITAPATFATRSAFGTGFDLSSEAVPAGATGTVTATGPTTDAWVVQMTALVPTIAGGFAIPVAAIHYVTP